jgi:hypothetical protein
MAGCYIVTSFQMPRLNGFKNLAFIFSIFLAPIESYPIIGESSTQGELIITDLKLLSSNELEKDNSVLNNDDKPNEVPKNSYVSSMFEDWLPESKGIQTQHTKL